MFEVRRNGDASQDRPDRCEERAECFACVAFEEYNFRRFDGVGDNRESENGERGGGVAIVSFE
jgi:hypothetical protein